MTNDDKMGKSPARPDAAVRKDIPKDPKGSSPHPGHQVPHGSGEGATGMQPGAGHPRGR